MKENNKETVCAVVVSYNRKKLLLECLEALRKQTRAIQGIYLIDNASTDGTPIALLDKGYIKEFSPESLSEPWEREFEIKNLIDNNSVKFHYVRMHENTGGAGGFYEGVKRAYEKGYDWLWLMDDDAEPKFDTLENLLKFKDENSVICPLIVMKDGRVQSYHHKIINTLLCLEKAAINSNNIDRSRILELDANAFVGPLISRNIISKIGFPKKELFIWGDDTEYTLRIKKQGFKIKLVTESIIYHKDSGYAFLSNPPPNLYWKIYYGMRNKIFIARKYCSKFGIAYWFIRTIFSFLKHRNVKLLKVKLKGIIDGLFLE